MHLWIFNQKGAWLENRRPRRPSRIKRGSQKRIYCLLLLTLFCLACDGWLVIHRFPCFLYIFCWRKFVTAFYDHNLYTLGHAFGRFLRSLDLYDLITSSSWYYRCLGPIQLRFMQIQGRIIFWIHIIRAGEVSSRQKNVRKYKSVMRASIKSQPAHSHGHGLRKLFMRL